MIQPELVPVLLLFAIMIVINLVGIRAVRNRSAQRKERVPFEQTSEALRHRSDQVMLQIEEFSRDVSGRVDNKIQYLEVLLAEADRKIEHLKHLDNQDH
ncbi:MAG: hypothetical protein QF752_16810 [Planctomycetota bacterium]|nr:hypothetical protein [Planctomycetota bacterium]